MLPIASGWPLGGIEAEDEETARRSARARRKRPTAFPREGGCTISASATLPSTETREQPLGLIALACRHETGVVRDQGNSTRATFHRLLHEPRIPKEGQRRTRLVSLPRSMHAPPSPRSLIYASAKVEPIRLPLLSLLRISTVSLPSPFPFEFSSRSICHESIEEGRDTERVRMEALSVRAETDR